MTTQDRPTYFPFYESFYETTKLLSDAQLREFINGLCEYAYTGEVIQSEDKLVTALVVMAKPNIDVACERWSASKKGGRKSSKSADANENETSVKPRLNHGLSILEAEKEKEMEKEKEKENEKEIESEKERIVKGNQSEPVADAPTPSSTSPKHEFGEFHHVLLSDSEYEKLSDDLPDVDAMIKRLDEYLELHPGKHYANHNLVLRKWANGDSAAEKGPKIMLQGTSAPKRPPKTEKSLQPNARSGSRKLTPEEIQKANQPVYIDGRLV